METTPRKEYTPPEIHDLGDAATLTAGSKSGGSETTKSCANPQNYWSNTTTTHV